MDAATAALFGAAIGLSGTLIAPIVIAHQAKRSKAQELMREAYSRGFACLAKIPRCSATDDHLKLRDKMLDALAHIEIVGTAETSRLYGEVVETYEAWKIEGAPDAAFASRAREFQHAARRDIDTADSHTMSTPAILIRLILPIAGSSIYWSLRFPILTRPAADALTGLEIGIALVATVAGLCFAGDAIRRFSKLLRRGGCRSGHPAVPANVSATAGRGH